jgi:GT2 family glycosyltransferase
MKPPPTAWVIPVHNRRLVTLACLRRLRDDGVLEWSSVYVVDDGSTDGTADAIAAELPSVRILQGDGNRWWTGATELGMRAAYAAGAEWIGWLNDDAAPRPGACAQLCATAVATGAVVTGQCVVPPDGPVVYGGLRRRRVGLQLVEASGSAPVPIDAACGNFVVFPRAVVATIGFPDGRRLPHAHGDSDYTLRARRAGFTLLVEPRAVAEARPNALANYASWLLSEIRLTDIWRQLADKRSYAYAPSHARFLARHFGIAGALYWAWTILKRVPITMLRCVVPQRWLRRLWGTRSAAWQSERQLHAALERGREPPVK